MLATANLPAGLRSQIDRTAHVARIWAGGWRRSSRSATAPTRSGWSAPPRPSTPATGEVLRSYTSASEPDGITYLRCGNRRRAVCQSCSHEYQGDVLPRDHGRRRGRHEGRAGRDRRRIRWCSPP